MAERPRFMDDLAGVAGGAFSALAGIREEAESMVRARVEEAIRKLDLVRREDLDAVMEMAANARAGQEAAELRLAALEARLDAHMASLSGTQEDAGRPRRIGGRPGLHPTRARPRGARRRHVRGRAGHDAPWQRRSRVAGRHAVTQTCFVAALTSRLGKVRRGEESHRNSATLAYAVNLLSGSVSRISLTAALYRQRKRAAAIHPRLSPSSARR